MSRRHPTAAHPVEETGVVTVVLDRDAATGEWVSHVPELAGISTFGQTRQEALDNTAEMILGYLDSMEDVGLEVPLSAEDVRRLRKALSNF